ncbi:hypothetical protein BDW69DRAFT_183517 [Aspergillus filifer]
MYQRTPNQVIRCAPHDFIECMERICLEEEELAYGPRYGTRYIFFDDIPDASEEDSSCEDNVSTDTAPSIPGAFPTETRSSTTRPPLHRRTATRSSAGGRSSANRSAASRSSASRSGGAPSGSSDRRTPPRSRTTEVDWTALNYVRSVGSDSDDDTHYHCDSSSTCSDRYARPTERSQAQTSRDSSDSSDEWTPPRSRATEENWTALNYVRSLAGGSNGDAHYHSDSSRTCSDRYERAARRERESSQAQTSRDSSDNSSRRERVASAASKSPRRTGESSQGLSSKGSNNRRSSQGGSSRMRPGRSQRNQCSSRRSEGAAAPLYDDAPPAYETLFPSRSRR